MAASMEDANELVKQGFRVNLTQQVLGQFLEDPRARRMHFEQIPHHEEYLRERAEFVENFFALQQEGLAKGFLDEGHCYECSGPVTPHTSTGWSVRVWDETEDEHQARLAALVLAQPPSVSFHVKKPKGTIRPEATI